MSWDPFNVAHNGVDGLSPCDRTRRGLDVKVTEKQGNTIILVEEGRHHHDWDGQHPHHPIEPARGGRFQGPDTKTDTPLSIIANVPEDGMYDLTAAIQQKVADAGGNSAFAITIAYVRVTSGVTTQVITVDLTTLVGGSVAVLGLLLLKGSQVTIQSNASNLTYGVYDLFASLAYRA